MMKMINKIKMRVIIILYNISKIIKKRNDLWLFGAWEGQLYSDNSKYLFEYVNKEHPEINAIWISRNKNVVEKLKNKGYKAYYYKSFEYFINAMRAAVVFQTEGNQDFGYAIYGGARIIQLWHGAGPKINKWDTDKFTSKDTRKRGISNYFEESYWMCPSERYMTQLTTMPMFYIPLSKDKMYLTGLPRNDTFVSKPKSEFLENFRTQHGDAKLIVYMPTHRNFGKEEAIPEFSIDALKKVNDFLKERNYFMLYKPHFHELKKYANVEFEKTMDHIILAKDAEIFGDPYQYLHGCDMMISDYSSVLYDFICSGKPVVLFPFDIDKFDKDDAGLEDYYLDVPPGPICYSWDEVFTKTDELFKQDLWVEKREKSRKLLHNFIDGKNCERVYNSVIEIIKKEHI